MLGLAAVSATAFMAFASTASATTLEVGGTAKNESVSISSSLATGTSAILKSTSGSTENTCTTSSVEGSTAKPFTAEVTKQNPRGSIGGPISTLSWSNCTRSVTVHSKGDLEVAWTSGTNGTLYSKNAEVTVGAPIVGYLICVTSAEGTQIGTATGVTKAQEEAEPPIKHAAIHISANLDCGISGVWTGTYTVTSPTGLGIVK
jgi:hypothetical protein